MYLSNQIHLELLQTLQKNIIKLPGTTMDIDTQGRGLIQIDLDQNSLENLHQLIYKLGVKLSWDNISFENEKHGPVGIIQLSSEDIETQISDNKHLNQTLRQLKEAKKIALKLDKASNTVSIGILATCSPQEFNDLCSALKDSDFHLELLHLTESTPSVPAKTASEEVQKMSADRTSPQASSLGDTITSFAELAREIKILKRADVKGKLGSKFASATAKSKKPQIAQTTGELATPEQISVLKNIFENAGLLVLKDAQYTATDMALVKASVVDQVVGTLIDQNLSNLAFTDELIISKFLYKKIQNKIAHFTQVHALYDTRTNVGSFIDQFIQYTEENKVNLANLTYSANYPFEREVFDRILDQGLTTADKINMICFNILGIDGLPSNINTAYFMQANKNKQTFLTTLSTELKAKGYDLQQLANDSAVLQAAGLKLDVALLNELPTTGMAVPPPPPPPRRPNPMLDQISARKLSAEETTTDTADAPPIRAVNPMLAQIAAHKPSTTEAATDTSDAPPIRAINPMLAQIATRKQSAAEAETDTSDTPPIRAVNPMLAQIAAKKTLKPASSSATENDTVNVKLSSSVTPPPVPEMSLRDKLQQQMQRKTPAKPPEPTSSSCKFTVNTKNIAYLRYIEAYLNAHFDYEKKSPPGEYILKNTIPASTGPAALKQAIVDLAQHLSEHPDIRAFSGLFRLDKYQQAFQKTLYPEGNEPPMMHVAIAPMFRKKEAQFEALLTEHNILFYKDGDAYVMDPNVWDPALLSTLKQQGFNADLFHVSNTHKNPVISAVIHRINELLIPDTQLVFIQLQLPDTLQSRFKEAFEHQFGSDPNCFIDEKSYLSIPVSHQRPYIAMIKAIGSSHLHAEYFRSDNAEFQEINAQLGYRLKISLPLAKDNEALQTFFLSNPKKNAREINGDDVTYYVDLSTLAHMKAELINLAVKHNLVIEYFDIDNNTYQSIENAQDPAVRGSPDGTTTSEEDTDSNQSSPH